MWGVYYINKKLSLLESYIELYEGQGISGFQSHFLVIKKYTRFNWIFNFFKIFGSIIKLHHNPVPQLSLMMYCAARSPHVPLLIVHSVAAFWLAGPEQRLWLTGSEVGLWEAYAVVFWLQRGIVNLFKSCLQMK